MYRAKRKKIKDRNIKAKRRNEKEAKTEEHLAVVAEGSGPVDSFATTPALRLKRSKRQ